MSVQYSLFEENKPMLGNKSLVDYGIQNEESDYRAHVCYKYGSVFIFKTEEGRRACPGCKSRPVMTGSVITAMGYLVPVHKIRGVSECRIPEYIKQRIKIYDTDTTTTKGLRAVQIVTRMAHDGLIALALEGNVVETHKEQVAGLDLLVWGKHKIQVKCDLPGGLGKGYTGNLFLQYAECNPQRRY